MKKIIKSMGYILFLLLYIWATVRVQFCWFEWFKADAWMIGLIVAVCFSICCVALSVFAGIKVVKKKTFLFPMLLLVVYLLMIIFMDSIDCFFSNLFGTIGPGILPEDISRMP